MGFFENIKDDIYLKGEKLAKKLREKREETFFSELENLKNNIDSFEKASMIKETIYKKYEDIFNSKSFVYKSLYENKFEILLLFDNELKKNFIKDLSSSILENNSLADYPGYVNSKYVNFEKAISYFPNSLFKDKEFIYDYVELYPNMIKYASDEIINDREFILQLASKDSNVLDYINPKYFADRDFMLRLIEKNSVAISRTSKTILDEKFVEEAFNINRDSFGFINYEEYQENKELMLKYIDSDFSRFSSSSMISSYFGRVVRPFYSLLKNDKEFCSEILDRGLLEYYVSMGDEIKREPDIIDKAMEKFKEFDAALDYDIDRISQYPSKIVDVFSSINFRKERQLLKEKININEKQETNIEL